MEIRFRKLNNDRHRVTVERTDGSTESVELDSKDFLRHDLAHFGTEIEVGLEAGVWGCVAAGASLDGTGLDGADMEIAEHLTGPMQTIMRTEGNADAILAILHAAAPHIASHELATRIHHRLRALNGHWAGTPFGENMTLHWPEPTTTE